MEHQLHPQALSSKHPGGHAHNGALAPKRVSIVDSVTSHVASLEAKVSTLTAAVDRMMEAVEKLTTESSGRYQELRERLVILETRATERGDREREERERREREAEAELERRNRQRENVERWLIRIGASGGGITGVWYALSQAFGG